MAGDENYEDKKDRNAKRLLALAAAAPAFQVVASLKGLSSAVPRALMANFDWLPKITTFYQTLPVFRTHPIFESLNFVVAIHNRISATWGPLLNRQRRLWEEIKAFEESGWLPHATTPVDLIGNLEGDDLRGKLDAYYKQHWPEVKDWLLRQMATYQLDVQAYSSFLDAVDLHEKGRYSSVPKILFAELERLTRIELAITADEGAASQKKLRDIAAEMPIGEEPGGWLAYLLFKALDEHAYLDTRKHPSVVGHAIPNRHAVIHGLASYDSHQSSMNMLLLADYIMGVLHESKTVNNEDDANAA